MFWFVCIKSKIKARDMKYMQSTEGKIRWGRVKNNIFMEEVGILRFVNS
jgi:hypothetical protein